MRCCLLSFRTVSVPELGDYALRLRIIITSTTMRRIKMMVPDPMYMAAFLIGDWLG
jgi:hypothetical protein